MVDEAALRDLVVVRVGDHNLVDRLVRVSRHPLLGLKARLQLLCYLPWVADVA